MLSIGAIQSALDWFLALDMWEECVACYNTQGYRHKVNYRGFIVLYTCTVLKLIKTIFYRLQKFLTMSLSLLTLLYQNIF